TSRSCATWTASGPWRKPGSRRSRPPSGSPAVRNPGSAAIPASAGLTPACPPKPSWPRRSRSTATGQVPELAGERVGGEQPRQQVRLDGERQERQADGDVV